MDTNIHAYTIIRAMMKGSDEESIKWTSDKNMKIFFEFYSFLNSTNIKNVSIEKILYYVFKFIKYADSLPLELQNLTIVDLNNYGVELSKSSNDPNCRARHLVYVRKFVNWGYDKKYFSITGTMAFPTIKWYKRINIMSFYSEEEIQALLNSYDVTTKKGKEQYLLVAIIASLGLRVSDAVNIRLSKIDFINKTIKICQFKTNVEIIIPFDESLLILIADYLKNVRPNDCDLDYLFVTDEKPYRHKSELRSHYHIVANHFKTCGIELASRKHGFHALRHSFSTRMLNANTSIYDISKMLGHTSVEVTNTYLNVDLRVFKELSLEVPIHEF